MIPTDLRKKLEEQLQPHFTKDGDAFLDSLRCLGIAEDCEFAAVSRKYTLGNILSREPVEELVDVAGDDGQSASESAVVIVTRFVHDCWGVPERYICFSSVEAEGGFFLDRESNQVFDVSLEQVPKLASGELQPRWAGFYEFLAWYAK